MLDATENVHFSELVGQQLRMDLTFTFHLENVADFIVLRERMSLGAVDKIGVVEKNI